MSAEQVSAARTLTALAALVAKHVHCGHCWSAPQHPCTEGGQRADGVHLARFARARRRGLISLDEIAAVLALAGPVLTPAVLVRDGAR